MRLCADGELEDIRQEEVVARAAVRAVSQLHAEGRCAAGGMPLDAFGRPTGEHLSAIRAPHLDRHLVPQVIPGGDRMVFIHTDLALADTHRQQMIVDLQSREHMAGNIAGRQSDERVMEVVASVGGDVLIDAHDRGRIEVNWGVAQLDAGRVDGEHSVRLVPRCCSNAGVHRECHVAYSRRRNLAIHSPVSEHRRHCEVARL